MHYLLLFPVDQLVNVGELAMSYGSFYMFMEPIITKVYSCSISKCQRITINKILKYVTLVVTIFFYEYVVTIFYAITFCNGAYLTFFSKTVAKQLYLSTL
jgi:hypothetical protein